MATSHKTFYTALAKQILAVSVDGKATYLHPEEETHTSTVKGFVSLCTQSDEPFNIGCKTAAGDRVAFFIVPDDVGHNLIELINDYVDNESTRTIYYALEPQFEA